MSTILQERAKALHASEVPRHDSGEFTEKPSSVAGTALSGKPAIVLDTNAVLDWRVFADPGMHALGAALEGGALRWIVTVPMLDELADVLRRTAFARWAGAADAALAFALAQATRIETPVVPLAAHPVCRDPDDQKFIDLALAAPARWLVTRDKALLALRRPAAARGVTVCTPAQWAP